MVVVVPPPSIPRALGPRFDQSLALASKLFVASFVYASCVLFAEEIAKPAVVAPNSVTQV
jgi:hypothetical protein